MKAFLLSVLVVLVATVGVVRADDNVRAVQTRLKTDGFYFGAVNGNYDSETAAAVSRYQIRNGLPISGQLDAETAKSLGVAIGATAPKSAAATETWQRLRRTDRQFLQKMDTGAVAPPAPPKAASRQASAPAPPRDAAPLQPINGDGSKLVLSRERLRDYVAAFVLAGLDPRIGSELDFFADQVNYYGDGLKDREKIRADLQRYANQWPQRRFWLAGQVDVRPQPDSRIRVTFPLRFDLRNGAKHSSGTVRKTLLLEVRGEDLAIVSVNERKA
jgi:peptidoglycan hydrolase-like protein with peptidoglycan-binding domain